MMKMVLTRQGREGYVRAEVERGCFMGIAGCLRTMTERWSVDAVNGTTAIYSSNGSKGRVMP